MIVKDTNIISYLAYSAKASQLYQTINIAVDPLFLLALLNSTQLMADNAINQNAAAIQNYVKRIEQVEADVKAELTPVCQFRPLTGPEMVLIAEGQFSMGSPENEMGRFANESPQHTVNILKPFSISRCEVTIAEFKQFIEATSYKTDAEKGKGCYAWDTHLQKMIQKSRTSWRNPGFYQQDNHPVACVSWVDAQAYIKWLNDRLGLTDKPYRLPNEAEWEYAARAGTTTPFLWGNNSQCDTANGTDSAMKDSKQFPADLTYASCSDQFVYTAPAGSFKPNAWGLYDMSGNVWEWVEDCWHDSYKNAPVDSRVWQTDQAECTMRSVRGGSWDDNPWNLRAAIRYNPVEVQSDHGFRLARTL